jgi:hypothetical protein
MGVAEGAATGVAGGAAIGEVEVVAGAGTENNSKSRMRMGIDGTGDSAVCGCAKHREISKAEVRTKKTKIRMAQVNFACRAGDKNMRDSLGRVIYQNTRRPGRKRMETKPLFLGRLERVQPGRLAFAAIADAVAKLE